MKKMCVFYKEGYCKNGNNCSYSHSYYNNTTCFHFLKGTCPCESGCKFFHGYSDTLMNLSKLNLHDTNINSFIHLFDKRFATASEDGRIKLWDIGPFNIIFDQTLNKPITKLTYFNSKVIFAVQEKLILNAISKIIVLDDNGSVIECQASASKINDILSEKSLCLFLTAGDTGVQVWYIDENIKQIRNYQNFIHSTEKSDIICLAYHNLTKLLFAGFKNGSCAAWVLNDKLTEKKFEESINKILFKEGVNDSYIFTCSSDGFINLWSINSNFDNKFSKKFDEPVYDMYFSKNFYKQDIYFLQIGNDLVALDDDLNFWFKIPSLSNSFTKRFVIEVENQNANDKEGNFLICTDKGELNINMWVKSESVKSNMIKSTRNINLKRGGF